MAVRYAPIAQSQRDDMFTIHVSLAAVESNSTSLKEATARVARFCSSTVFRSAGSVGAARCIQTWRTSFGSYGPLVILDYIRQYRQGAISGIVFVDALTKLGSDEALSVLTPELLNIVPGLFATDAEQSIESLDSLLRVCFVTAPSPEDLYLMLGFNLTVPPYVRQALFSRSFDNDDLTRQIVSSRPTCCSPPLSPSARIKARSTWPPMGV